GETLETHGIRDPPTGLAHGIRPASARLPDPRAAPARSAPPAARNRTPTGSIEQFPLLGHPKLRLILCRTGQEPIAVANPPHALRKLLLVCRSQVRRVFIPLPVTCR